MNPGEEYADKNRSSRSLNDDIEEVVLYAESPPGAYVLVNGKMTYRLPKGFSVSFAVNNIGNEQYEEMAKYRMPGRSYAIGFGWELQ